MWRTPDRFHRQQETQQAGGAAANWGSAGTSPTFRAQGQLSWVGRGTEAAQQGGGRQYLGCGQARQPEQESLCVARTPCLTQNVSGLVPHALQVDPPPHAVPQRPCGRLRGAPLAHPSTGTSQEKQEACPEFCWGNAAALTVSKDNFC